MLAGWLIRSKCLAILAVGAAHAGLPVAAEAAPEARPANSERPLIVLTGPARGPKSVAVRFIAETLQSSIAQCRTQMTPAQTSGVGARDACPGLRIVHQSCGRGGKPTFDAAISSIIAARPSLVIGPPCERVSVTAAKRYAQDAIPFVLFGVRPDVLSELPVWRGTDATGSGGRAFAFGGSACASDERIVIVSDQARRSMDRVQDVLSAIREVRRNGRRVWSKVVRIQSGPQDFAQLAKRVLRQRPSRVVAFIGGAEAAAMVTALRQQGYQRTIAGPQDWISDVPSATFTTANGSGRLLAIATTFSRGVLVDVVGSKAVLQQRIRALVDMTPIDPTVSMNKAADQAGWYAPLTASFANGVWSVAHDRERPADDTTCLEARLKAGGPSR